MFGFKPSYVVRALNTTLRLSATDYPLVPEPSMAVPDGAVTVMESSIRRNSAADNAVSGSHLAAFSRVQGPALSGSPGRYRGCVGLLS